MSVEILVATSDPTQRAIQLPTGETVHGVLADDGSTVTTVYISDLLRRLFEDVRDTVDFECTVDVKVSGSLTLAGKGETKLLVFNVGGSIEAQTTMTVELTATLPGRRT